MRPVLVTLTGPSAAVIDPLATQLAERGGETWALAGKHRADDAPKARLILVPGELPEGFEADLEVFVVPVDDTPLLVQVPVDPIAAQQARLDLILADPDALNSVLAKLNARFGNPVDINDDVRSGFADALQVAGPTTQESPHLQWTLSDRYAGLERSSWVLFVLNDDSQRAHGEQLRRDFVRIRNDDTLFAQVIGDRGFRDDVPAALIDLNNRHSLGLKALFTRLKRLLRR
ncbi:MAG: hypothetical protein GWP91_03325 [Rhodobacterales bacterium]|nr:hypothetical protein [Rhodobacterales bacterium]